MKRIHKPLKDIITGVEKLNAAQQLTATIILSSVINMMSNEEDWCFYAKNQDTLHDTALSSNVMNVMNMDILLCKAIVVLDSFLYLYV